MAGNHDGHEEHDVLSSNPNHGLHWLRIFVSLWLFDASPPDGRMAGYHDGHEAHDVLNSKPNHGLHGLRIFVSLWFFDASPLDDRMAGKCDILRTHGRFICGWKGG